MIIEAGRERAEWHHGAAMVRGNREADEEEDLKQWVAVEM